MLDPNRAKRFYRGFLDLTTRRKLGEQEKKRERNGSKELAQTLGLLLNTGDSYSIHKSFGQRQKQKISTDRASKMGIAGWDSK